MRAEDHVANTLAAVAVALTAGFALSQLPSPKGVGISTVHGGPIVGRSIMHFPR